MTTGFVILTILFTIVSSVMILIILVQRPQGGGLAGAFGGASGGGTDTVFGGRVGDALTAMTVGAFVVYLAMAIGLNIVDPKPSPTSIMPSAAESQPAGPDAAPTSQPVGVTATMPASTSPAGAGAPDDSSPALDENGDAAAGADGEDPGDGSSAPPATEPGSNGG